MKRSPMPARRTPLRQTAGLARRTRLRHRSKRMSDQQRGLAAQVQAWVADDVRCQLGPVVCAYDGWHECTGAPQGGHELRKRSAGGGMHPANRWPACNACNEWVEMWPLLAHQLGLVARRGDPDWQALGHNDLCAPYCAHYRLRLL